MIKAIPWKALGVFVIGLVLGVYLGGSTTVKAIVTIFDTDSVSRSLNKPTNLNTTSIEFKDNKFKKSDSIKIQLSQEPKTKQTIKNDSCAVTIKEYNKLTNIQKNKFKRWLR